MLTANKLMPQGRGLAPVLLKRAATVELDWDVRQKSRFDATDSTGRRIGVFLPRGTLVRGGDVLVAEDGSLVRVVAAPQAVLRITHCASHGTPFDLTRAAYHLGNRHVPIELNPAYLQIEPDHVLAEMLRSQHLIVREATEPFEPEGGAYGAHSAAHGGHGHAAGHAHAHGHDHGAPQHAHAHAPAAEAGHVHAHDTAPAHGAPGHVHGPGCAHGHHDHGHTHDHTPAAPATATHGAPGHVHGPGCAHGDHDHDHDHAPAPAPVAVQFHAKRPGHA
ncbi:urease accessory protein UreE [Xylophilus ampelinus]|uniref:Urease accessory protein UreE n=1 Tax=Xylophilus ampelinus TaxID=54067 RepID=A0A318SIC5_9BURK|nr:urease accessory protein UreE [Xylophilus ampelinus]MCS4511732.1 urease accessory protein UreE [Xylophilus ampelinus]PYE73784.1 urease accessory protein [Xylophilus ampelinus]